MYNGVYKLYSALREKEFKKIIEVIITDRSIEFTCAEALEKLGCHVFYCDPMAPYQKSHVEQNHNLFRYICPSGNDLKKLGLYSQEDVNLIFSHVNSYRRESLMGKSPIEVFNFFHSNSNILEKPGIKEIDSDQIILKPNLIKKIIKSRQQ